MKKWIILLIVLSACDFRVRDEEARNELEKVPIQFGDLTVGQQSIHYAYTDQSKDDLIVFIHGSPGSWNAFIDFFKADSLLDTFDIIALDRPGFGKSDFGRAEPSMKRQAELMHSVLKQFRHKNKYLVGHSLGGPVIARMAMDYPTAYKGLVFVAPSIDPEMEKDEWYRSIIDTKVGSWLTPKAFEVSNDEILPLKEELKQMLLLWRKIRIPTIIIHGIDDSLVPVQNVVFAKRMLPDSLLEVQILLDTDHFIPWTNPEAIIEAIRRMADRTQ